MWGHRIPEVSVINYQNLEIHITGYTDSEELGLADRESQILGISELTIPYKYLRYFRQCSERLRVEEEEREKILKTADFVTYNSDLIIEFFHWALYERKRKISVEMNINHYYWLFHDLYHAEHHTFSCDLNVGAEAERETLISTFDLAEEAGYQELTLLTRIEAEELIEVYNQRFKGHRLGYDFFDRYILPEEVEELEE